MKQLGGLDSLFVHAEQQGLPMHISSVSIYNPSTAEPVTGPTESGSRTIPSDRVHFNRIVKFYDKTIRNNLPILRSKLSQVPMNLDQPYWLEDKDFDVEYHMRYSALPAPGDWDTLCQHLANLHAQPLNRNVPLWEAHIIDGLHTAMDVPEGSFGVLFKVHHAIMDGETGMAIFTSLHSMDNKFSDQLNQSTDTDTVQQLPPPTIEAKPGRIELLSKAYLQNSSRTLKLVKTLSQILPVYKRLRKGLDEQRLRIIEDKPKTRFNGEISQHRVVNRIETPFSDIRKIRSLVPGATVNDVALTIIGGAIRGYLSHYGELPHNSIVASIPINVRSQHQSDEGKHSETKANVLSVMNCVMGTNIADPKARLQEVYEGSQLSKAFAEEMGHDLLNDLSDCLYAGIASWGLHKIVASGVLSLLPPASNTVVTNVPGAPIPFYLCGCKMVDSFGLGPLIPNSGMFHTVSNTYDRFSISVVADRVMMPDPQFYRQCMDGAYRDLLAACEPDDVIADVSVTTEVLEASETAANK